MTQDARRRRTDRWIPLLIPVAVAVVLGSYAYTYRETGGLAERFRQVENLLTRVLCRVAPDECLRGGPR